MGISNSKLNAAEGDEIPPKTGPPISTLSNKQLLNEEDDNSQSSYKTETEDKVSSSEEIETPKEETEAQVITAEKLSREVPMPNSECDIVEENHPNKDNTEQVNKDMDPKQDTINDAVEMAEAEVETEEENNGQLVEETKEEKEQEVGAKGDDKDEDETEDVGRFICPGSPSFRIYCIEAEKRNEQQCNCPTIVVHQKSRSVDTVQIAKSKYSNHESKSTSKRKGRKKKFRAMKSLLKVKSLYHPMCTCTGNDKSLIVAEKQRYD